MGLRFIRRRRDEKDDERRFNAYFPRAFAYVYSNLGAEALALEVVDAGFSRALTSHGHEGEEAFRLALFVALRELCQERKRKMPLDIGLGKAERDVVTLTFDAGLQTWEVNTILGTQTAALHLSNALRKMRELSSPSIIPSFFRLP
jgi:DNA-directed RNA polymerase specialized sigma24 family protein